LFIGGCVRTAVCVHLIFFSREVLSYLQPAADLGKFGIRKRSNPAREFRSVQGRNLVTQGDAVVGEPGGSYWQ
jgi:hypothetical protein